MCLPKRKSTPAYQWCYDSDLDYKSESFKDALLSGVVQEDNIRDYVAYYHSHKDKIQVSLPEFLGMSDNQYVEWVMGAHVSLTELLSIDI